MRIVLRTLFGLNLLIWAAACTGTAQPTVDPESVRATVNAVLTAEAPPATTVPEPTAIPLPSFEVMTYTDSSAGFAFDYPAGWVVGPLEQHSRGGITPFTSWERPSDVLPDQTPPGETRLDAVVQLWDPKGDLEAFVQQRMSAWEGSGISVTPQETWTLSDGRMAKSFVVQGVGGDQGYSFFTTLGDKYLVLSGEGDLVLLAEIAHTVRPAP